MRKEKLNSEIERLLSEMVSVANVSSCDEEFTTIEVYCDRKLARGKSLLKWFQVVFLLFDNHFFRSSSVARKKVLFAYSVVLEDELSSSGAEAIQSPTKNFRFQEIALESVVP